MAIEKILRSDDNIDSNALHLESIQSITEPNGSSIQSGESDISLIHRCCAVGIDNLPLSSDL